MTPMVTSGHGQPDSASMPEELYQLAERSGELVPVGRGGERRAIALTSPRLEGAPFATATM